VSPHPAIRAPLRLLRGRAAVAIPGDWQSLSWQERRSLASQLSDEPITNGEQANAAIEAELKRRNG
jgi:hypothetical protein